MRRALIGLPALAFATAMAAGELAAQPTQAARPSAATPAAPRSWAVELDNFRTDFNSVAQRERISSRVSSTLCQTTPPIACEAIVAPTTMLLDGRREGDVDQLHVLLGSAGRTPQNALDVVRVALAWAEPQASAEERQRAFQALFGTGTVQHGQTRSLTLRSTQLILGANEGVGSYLTLARPGSQPSPPPANPATPPPAQARSRDRLSNGGSAVPVWLNSRAFDEGLRLINAGVHQSQPTLVMRLLSCMAPDRSDIVVTDSGFFSSTILVVSGPQSGCRGVVPNEMIARR